MNARLVPLAIALAIVVGLGYFARNRVIHRRAASPPAATASLGPAITNPEEGAASAVLGSGSEPPIRLSSELSALLESTNERPRLRDVPPISPAEEAELLAQFRATTDLKKRYQLTRILCSAGCRGAFPLIAKALTNDYAGQFVTRAEEGWLLHSLTLLGLLAEKDDQALRFLLEASTTRFWTSTPLWEVSTRRVGEEALIGESLKGLVWSGTEEGRDRLRQLRDTPEEVATMGVESGVVDAAFYADSIAQYGRDEFVSDILEDFNRAMAEFRAWLTTTNGQWWDQWRAQVNRVQIERRRTSPDRPGP